MGSEGTVPLKSLAPWKTFWRGTSIAIDVATSIQNHIDPTKLPGKGALVTLAVATKVCGQDLDDSNNAKVMEGVLNAYPPDKDPSAYLLGDAVLHLNANLGNVLLGPESPNPVNEKSRRDTALKIGGQLKLLLSYIRTSTGRTEKGRSPTVTFLKELVVSKKGRRKSKGSTSTCSTMSADTMVLGGSSSASRSPICQNPDQSTQLLDGKFKISFSYFTMVFKKMVSKKCLLFPM